MVERKLPKLEVAGSTPVVRLFTDAIDDPGGESGDAGLLGPGILWRAFSERRVSLAFLPLPGLALLIVTVWRETRRLGAETGG